MDVVKALVNGCLSKEDSSSSSSSSSSLKPIAFIDSGISELLKYKKLSNINNDINDTIPVYSLEWPLSSSSSLLLYKPDNIVFIISTPLITIAPIIDSIINISKCNKVIILTTSSVYEIAEQLGKSDDDNDDKYDDDDPYKFLYSLFDHNNLTIRHLPLYSISILSSSSSSSLSTSSILLDARILSNPICRQITPLTLHKLGLWHSNSRINHINDIIGTDIDRSIAYDLKTLAHQIAGSLVYELGLNTTESIFALGKTSSLLGYNLQSYLPLLMKSLHNNDDDSNLLKSIGIDDQVDSNSLSAASLVLIDRTEDLFTPTSHSGDFPLAHRIISTINRSYGKIFKTNLNDNNDFDTIVDTYPLIDVDSKLSVLSSLSLQCALIPSSSDTDINNCIMTMNEAEGSRALCSKLASKLSSPPSPDDILSNIKELVTSNKHHNNDYNVKVCIENQDLLASSLAAVDAMNKSNSNSSWKCSFEMRQSREIKIENLMRKGHGLDVIVPELLSYLTANEEPADVVHIILQAMRVIAVLHDTIVDSIEMTLLSKSVAEYITNKCIEEELNYLIHMRILPAQILNDVMQYRKGDKSKQYVKADIQEILLTIMSRLIEISEIGKPPQADGITDILGNMIDNNKTTGVIAMSVKAMLDHRLYVINQSSLFRNENLLPIPMPSFEHIETPLQQLKRTGMSLISQGLGRFGFGNVVSNIVTSPHPADNSTIVIVVIGGLSFKEINEVHSVLLSYRSVDSTRIILLSTNIVNPDDQVNLLI